jgi:hypothetical protein
MDRLSPNRDVLEGDGKNGGGERAVLDGKTLLLIGEGEACKRKE